jgi:perosamine synthetase
MKRIPLARPDLSGNEEAYVMQAVRSSWISSSGAYIGRFEQEFAAFCGVKSAVGVCNGTMALHLALLALGLEPGDEVLVPSLTYIATANAVRYCGAEPVFVDVDPSNWCIDPLKLEAATGPRTRGIITVDLYGHPADADAVNAVAARHGLWVVEDAAEAHGARYKGRPAGSLAKVATFSFFGNKVMTSGEGGALTTDDPVLEQRIRLLRGQGMDPARRYYFPITGYNYRITNIAAALLCAQMERRDAILARRREIFARYREGLKDVQGIGLQPVAAWAEPTPWLYCVTVDENTYGESRDALMARLEAAGVETRPFFIPMHTLPPFAARSRARGETLPITESVAASGINLPTFNQMKPSEIDRVCGLIRKS